MPRFASTLVATSLLMTLPAFAQMPDGKASGVDLLRRAVIEAQSDHDRNSKIREALPVLRADAIAGDEKAQYNLARLYETGVPQGDDELATFPARAYAWYVAAARAGHPLAIKRIEATGSHPFGIEPPKSTTPPPSSPPAPTKPAKTAEPQAIAPAPQPVEATPPQEAAAEEVDLAALMEAAEQQAAQFSAAAAAPASPVPIATAADLEADKAAAETAPETASKPELPVIEAEPIPAASPALPEQAPKQPAAKAASQPELPVIEPEAQPEPEEEAEEPTKETETIIEATVEADPNMSLGTSYQIKIGTFRDAANAAALVEKLAAEGISALSLRKDDGEGGEWHMVQSAPLFDKAEADALVETLKRDYAADAKLVEIDGAYTGPELPAAESSASE
ncbi:MAG: SPOR domain-containing protein [Alphaproteobacteria bacterium]